MRYQIQIMDGSTLKAIVSNWREGRWTQSLYEPPVLSFKVDVEREFFQYLVPGHEVHLRSDMNGLEERFVVSDLEKVSPEGEATVTCQGVITLLRRGTVPEYHIDPDYPEHVSDIIQTMLGYQVDTNIGFGSIDIDKETVLSFERSSIYAALEALHRTIGGHFWVDTNKDLQWRESRGSSTGQQIRVGRNVNGVSHYVDFEAFANRVYAYGAGVGDDKVRLPNEYVEDSSSVSEYGVVEKVVYDRRITNIDTLLDFANVHLERGKDPIHCYTINAVELARVLPEFSFDYWVLGDKVVVVDEGLEIQTETQIVSIDRNLGDPTDAIVHLDNRRQNLIGAFGRILEDMEAEKQHNPIKEAMKDGGSIQEGIEEIAQETAEEVVESVQEDVDELQLEFQGMAQRVDDAEDDIESLQSSMDPIKDDVQWLTRTFVEETLADVNDLEESEEYPELEFRDGDRALVGGPVVPALYVRKSGTWERVWEVVIRVPHYTDLMGMTEGIPEGTVAYVEGTRYHYTLREGVWRVLGGVFDHNRGLEMEAVEPGNLYYDDDGVVSYFDDELNIIPLSHYQG